MGFWEKMTKDVQKDLTEGLNTIRKKTEELTGEIKKKYKVFDLKNKVHQHMADLGGTVYNLRSKAGNPMDNPKVKALIDKIKKIEAQVQKLEAGKAKKKPTRKKAAKKKAAGKTTRKTTAKKTESVGK